MADKVLLERSLWVMKLCGMHPKFRGFPERLKHVGLVSSLVFTWVSLIVEMVVNWKGTDTFENGIEVVFGTFQMIMKCLTALIFRRVILGELEKIPSFWPTDKFGEELEAELIKIYALVKRAFNGLLFLAGLADCMVCVKPFFTSDMILPLKTYNLCNTANNICYVGLYVWQIWHMFLLSVVLVAVDGLFFSFMSHAFCQFRMIKFGFEVMITEDVTEGDLRKKLGELVNQHALTLSFVKNTNRIFSLGLTGQLLSAVFNICTGTFLVSVDGFPPAGVRIIRYIPMLLLVLFQLFIYCLAGEKIVEESSSIADAAFSCPWTTCPHFKLREALCLVIQRTHISTTLSIAGLIDLNIETFGGMVRKAGSLFMAIQQLHTNEIQES